MALREVEGHCGVLLAVPPHDALVYVGDWERLITQSCSTRSPKSQGEGPLRIGNIWRRFY